jgi:hypothetical protein
MPHCLHAVRSLVLIALVWPVTAAAQFAGETIRSAVPLWSGGGPDVWPQSLSSKTEIGVTSIVGIGDWKIVDIQCAKNGGREDCVTWMRVGFVGVFDLGFTFREAKTQAGLGSALAEPGFIVVLPRSKGSAGDRLLAFEIGMRGGSRYVLVRPDGAPKLQHFDVLSGGCAGADESTWDRDGFRYLKAEDQSFFRTDYCLVRTREGLAALATRSASGAPVATMSLERRADY